MPMSRNSFDQDSAKLFFVHLVLGRRRASFEGFGQFLKLDVLVGVVNPCIIRIQVAFYILGFGHNRTKWSRMHKQEWSKHQTWKTKKKQFNETKFGQTGSDIKKAADPPLQHISWVKPFIQSVQQDPSLQTLLTHSVVQEQYNVVFSQHVDKITKIHFKVPNGNQAPMLGQFGVNSSLACRPILGFLFPGPYWRKQFRICRP